MGIADDTIRRFERLRARRSGWEHHWQEVAEFFQPRHADFVGSRAPGGKRAAKLFDATPVLVPQRFAAAMESLMTPRGAFWHGLKTADDGLNAHPPVRQWLDDVRRRLFRFRDGARAGFAANMGESYLALGLYGTQVLYTEEGFGPAPVLYRSLPLAECYVDTDFTGRVDTLCRLYRLSARQAAQRWGAARLSGRAAKMLDDPAQADAEIPFLSCVFPGGERGPALAGMPFVSVHVELDQRHLVATGGYHEFPFHVSRFAQSSREAYGRGPAMTVLADAKMLNAMNRTTMRAAEKAVDPPLGIADDGDMPRPNLNPGAINPGAVSADGKPLIQPISSGARPEIGEAQMEAKRGVINDAFWMSLFRILADAPSLTATEVMERAREKAELIGPALARQETELLGPMIEREVGILGRKGLLPAPPPELDGVPLSVDYTSPMARLRRAADGAGILRTMETATAVADFRPDIWDNLDLDGMVREMADISGVPPRLVRGAGDVALLRAARESADA